MNRQRDLELLLRSRTPIIVIETRDESRMLDRLANIVRSRAGAAYVPLFRWSVTDGLQRLDIELAPQPHNTEPALSKRHLLDAIRGTRPLSVLMAEKVARLRKWADGRTVPCD